MAEQDWETFLAPAEEVRPTPPDVRDRIWARVVAAAPLLGDDPGSPDVAPVVVELDPTGSATPDRRRARALALLAAAAAVVVAVVWVARTGEPEPAPLAAGSDSCAGLQQASADLTLLAFDGPPVTVAQLDLLVPALDAFVDDLERAGQTPTSELTRWREATRQLRQASVDGSAGTDGAAGVAAARFALDGLIDTSDDPLVTTCFARWPG